MKSMWDKEPTKSADEAFCVGNGRLGATLTGGGAREVIYLNEERIWSRAYSDRNNPDAAPTVRRVRELAAARRTSLALQAAAEGMAGCPAKHAFYAGAGSVTLEFYDAAHKGYEESAGVRYTDCERALDFDAGIASVKASAEVTVRGRDVAQDNYVGAATFTHECFAALDTDVIVYHISSTLPGSIYFRLTCETPGGERVASIAGDTLAAPIAAHTGGALVVCAASSGGRVFSRGETLFCEGADDATIYIDIGCAEGARHSSRAGFDSALKRICFAMSEPYERARARQEEAWQEAARGGVLTVEGGKSARDAEKALRAWQLARHALLSSCTARSTVPCVRGGIWESSARGQDFNLMKGDALKESALMFGVDDAARTLSELAARLYKNGHATADRMYGADGIALHATTDIWGDAAPSGKEPGANFAPLGGAALARAILDCYEYTLDKDFLKRNMRILKAACRFFMDYLVSAPDSVRLTLSPAFSDSPARVAAEDPAENALVASLFEDTLKAQKETGTSDTDAFRAACAATLERLRAPEGGADAATQGAPQATDGGTAPDARDFDSYLVGFVCGVISCELVDGRAVITLLSAPPRDIPAGSLENVRLRGNIHADVSWKDGRFNGAKLYTRAGEPSVENVKICYDEQSYDARITDGTLDVRNVLPSTV